MSERIIELSSSKPLVGAYMQTLGATGAYAETLTARLIRSSATVYAYETNDAIQALLPVSGSESMDLWPMARISNAETWAARALLHRTLDAIGRRDDCVIINAHVPIDDEDLWELYLDAQFAEGRDQEHDVIMSLAARCIPHAQAALANQQA